MIGKSGYNITICVMLKKDAVFMKKPNGTFLKIFGLLAACLILCGCGAEQTAVPPTETVPETTEEPTFPSSAAVSCVAVGQMTAGEAEEAIRAAIGEYKLTAQIDGVTVTFKAEDLGLCYAEGTDLASAVASGTGAVQTGSAEALRDTLARRLAVPEERDVTLAGVIFDREKLCFTGVDGADRTEYDYSAAAEAIMAAARDLKPEVVTAGTPVVVPGQIAMETPQTAQAVEKGNALLDLQLTFVFDEPWSWEPTRVRVERADIASFLTLEADLSVQINRDAILGYTQTLADEHSSFGSNGRAFPKTGGGIIVLDSPGSGAWLDPETMADSLYDSLRNCVSGDLTAEYTTGDSWMYDYEYFGGNYVEVDLDRQLVFCYNNYELVIAAPCVSGCVAEDNMTPNGVYSFYQLSTDAWLEGPTWLDHVDYWMAFYGGYGMHDASWRDQFGGDIYLESGSHGCVNLPVEAAGVIFNNISYGTKIILYGGQNAWGEF